MWIYWLLFSGALCCLLLVTLWFFTETWCKKKNDFLLGWNEVWSPLKGLLRGLPAQQKSLSAYHISSLSPPPKCDTFRIPSIHSSRALDTARLPVASFLPCVKDKDHWIKSSFLLFASPVITLSHHAEGAWCLWALRWHTETWHRSREHRGVLTSGERRHHDVRKSRFFPSHYYVILTKETWSTLSVSPFLAHVFLKDTKPMSSPSPQTAPWGCPPLLLITFHADAAGPLLLLCMCDWSSVGWWWGTTRQEHAADTFGEVSSTEGFERHAKLQMEPDHPAFTKLVWKPWSNSQKTLLASYFL